MEELPTMREAPEEGPKGEKSLSHDDSIRFISALKEVTSILNQNEAGLGGTYTINGEADVWGEGVQDWSMAIDPSESLLTICKRLAGAHASSRVTFGLPMGASSSLWSSSGSSGEPIFTESGLKNRYVLAYSTPVLQEEGQDVEGALAGRDRGGAVRSRYRLRSGGPVEEYPNVMPRAL